MRSYFSSKFFRNNREKLRVLFAGKAPIIITANGLLQKSGDTTFPFRQDSNFWYLTGINKPDFILVMDKDKEYLIAPERSEAQGIMEGLLDLKPLNKISGLDILDNEIGWRHLGTRLNRVKHIATLAALPAYIDRYGFYANPARTALINKIQDINADIDLLDLRNHLARMRSIKQPDELLAIKAAIDITAKSLKVVKSKLKNYKYEYEIEAELSKEFMYRGASGHAFKPIVAVGPNASTIHYMSNNSPLSNNQLILIDVGAEVENYAADLSRTYAIGNPSKRRRAVFNAIYDAQSYAKSLLKPGITSREHELAVEHFIGEKLRELGLIKTINRKNVRHYFPTRTTHHLGLDTHDAEDYERPFEPGMVLAVEPGIYIPQEGIGVRLEDNVLITESGIETLSSSLPLDLS